MTKDAMTVQDLIDALNALPLSRRLFFVRDASGKVVTRVVVPLSGGVQLTID